MLSPLLERYPFLQGSGKQYSLKCSYLEIYNEQITDLLNPTDKRKLNLREDIKGVFVENLSGTKW